MTAEQRDLAESERAWLVRNNPIEYLRTNAPEGLESIDPRVLVHVAESGLASILTADAGGCQADVAVLTVRHGRAASSLPVADLALGAWLLEAAGLDELVASHTRGERYVTVLTAPLSRDLRRRPDRR
ncbi:hypothetical protein [Gordonia aurantiaca]|uniref:hypothetical protein n=1 Tax=Gordonia sp. B21 TaxID=3151852 RepID=UPI003266C79C